MRGVLQCIIVCVSSSRGCSAGLVHRDVKAGNILLAPGPRQASGRLGAVRVFLPTFTSCESVH
jgi:hypothetical protein